MQTAKHRLHQYFGGAFPYIIFWAVFVAIIVLFYNKKKLVLLMCLTNIALTYSWNWDLTGSRNLDLKKSSTQWDGLLLNQHLWTLGAVQMHKEKRKKAGLPPNVHILEFHISIAFALTAEWENMEWIDAYLAQEISSCFNLTSPTSLRRKQADVSQMRCPGANYSALNKHLHGVEKNPLRNYSNTKYKIVRVAVAPFGPEHVVYPFAPTSASLSIKHKQRSPPRKS